MTSPRAVPHRRGVVRFLLTGLAVVAVLLPATSAVVASPAAPASVPGAGPPSGADSSILTVLSVVPVVAGPGVPVTISGTLTARARALTQPTVRAVLGRPAIVSREDVRAWAADTGSASGKEVASATAGPLAPGQSTPFTLTIPDGSLTLARAWGVIPLALEVSDADPSNAEVRRTFLGWQRTKQYQPIALALVAPVTLSPSPSLFDPDSATRTAAWRDELGAGGRIDRIISGTDSAGVPVTWAIDPAILGPPASATSVPGADPLSALRAPVAARLAAASTRHTLWALPYADLDLAATVGTSSTDPMVVGLARRSGELERSLGVPVQSGVAWPADGGLQPPREQGLAAAFGRGNLSAALVSSSALPAQSGFTGAADRKSPNGLPLLAWDDELSELTLQTESAATAAMMTQQFIAESATLLAQSPGISRTFVVAMPRVIDPEAASMTRFLQALAATPWIRFVSTDEVQALAASRDPVSETTGGGWKLAGPAQIDAAALDQVAAERETIDRVAALFPDGAAYRAGWNDTLDQLGSVRWRQDPSGFGTVSRWVAAAGGEATSGIRVNAQTTNFLADEGILQVTVVNDLATPVEGLRLVLVPTNPRMRIVSQPDPVRIEKQSRATIQVRAQAVAAGLVPVTATLTTADGTPIGVGATLTVRANPPGRMFYVISGVVVGLILVIGIVRSLRRRANGGS